MKNVIITGSSGMVGSLVLAECLKSEAVSTVTVINRVASGIMHPKLIEVIHKDFLDYSSIENSLKEQDLCFFCIGVYTGVPVEDFKRITVDYTIAFADALKRNNNKLTFCFLSGEGADSTEKSRILFAKQKGIAENYLLNIGFEKTYIFRPGYIYPVTPRKEPNFGYKLMRALYKPIALIYSNIGVPSTVLAAKMVAIGLNGGGDRIIFHNEQIRK